MRFPHKAGPYDLLEQIGQGAFGSVYACRERSTGRVLALKVLGKVQGEGPRRRFEREGQALARLDHPSIVRVHTATWEGDHPHLALELVEGVDLEQRLEREGALEPEEARALLTPLAEAVAHAHERGVLHRDIKPSNVIVSAQGRPMLLDFGLASLADTERLTLSGQMLGTPAYMAPEQARGQWSERTDVYGLGALLFAALTGAPPVQGNSLAECLVQLMSGPPPDPRELSPEIPPGLAALCKRCLAKEPQARYSSASELARALAEVDMRPERSKGWLWVALGSGVVSLAGLIGLLALSGPPPASPPPLPSPLASLEPEPSPPASESPATPPLTAQDWDSLLFSDEVWDGSVDLSEVRSRTAPEHAGRVEVVILLGELAGQIRRGAPWRELRVSLDRLAAGPPWELLEQALPTLRARLLFERGRSAQTLQLLEGDDSPRARWLRFEIHAQKHQSPQALSILQELEKGDHAFAKLARSRLFRLQGDQQRALRLAQECAYFSHARLDVAMAQFALGDLAGGKRSLDEFLEGWGPTPTALSLCLELALHEREPLRALRFAERASALVEVEPDRSLAFHHARVLIALERWSDAQTLLEPLVPKVLDGETLTPPDVRLLTLLGVAYYDLPATRDRAPQAWTRACRGSNALIANPSFPPEASPAARTEFERIALSATQAPTGGLDLQDPSTNELAQAFFETWRTSPSKLRPLANLPKELALELAAKPDAPQALQDLRTSCRQAAYGKPWSEFHFFLVRALEAKTHGPEVRAAWIRLALAREADLELVERRIQGGDLPRYGLSEACAALYLGDVAWGQARTGQAAQRYAAAAKRWAGTDPGKLAAASLAILRDEFDLAEEHLAGIKEHELLGRSVALLGLAQVGQGRLPGALESARRAYRLSGALDARTLALRASLSAGLRGKLSSPPDKQLELAGWTARSLTLRACLASGVPAKAAWAMNSLQDARDEGAEPLLLLGYAVLLHSEKIKGAQRRTDAAWAAAQAQDPLLPMPASYLEAYTKAFGTKPKLSAR